MKTRFLLSLAAAATVSCATAGGARQYRNGDLSLVTAYTAKEACSCLFVMEQTEDYCRAWIRANPQVASFEVDWKKKTVQSSAVAFWGAHARFVDAKVGCVLE